MLRSGLREEIAGNAALTDAALRERSCLSLAVSLESGRFSLRCAPHITCASPKFGFSRDIWVCGADGDLSSVDLALDSDKVHGIHS